MLSSSTTLEKLHQRVEEFYYFLDLMFISLHRTGLWIFL